MANSEHESYKPQEFHTSNLAENKTRLSRRQQIILGLAGSAVGAAGVITAVRAFNSEPDNDYAAPDETATLTTETPTPKTEFTATLPSGNQATIEIPTPTPFTQPTNTPTPENTPSSTPEIIPDASIPLYDNLEAKIKNSTISEKEKSEYISIINEFKQIETIQARLLKAYNSELGPDSKTPALLYYTKLKYPHVPNLTPQSQIFILQNQNLLENTIRPQIKTLTDNFDQFQLKNVLEQISYNSNHVFNPEGVYLGLQISLSDYTALESSKESDSQITYENLSPAQVESLNKLSTLFSPLIGTFTVIGVKNFEPNLFQDQGQSFRLQINTDNIQSARHEWAHATSLSQNKSIAHALSPEELVHLLVLQEKALSDPQYGRQYATLEQLFTTYQELNPYIAGASIYPFETFVTNTEVDSQDKIFRIEPHDFATNTISGEKMTVNDVVKILDLKPAQYNNSQEFVNAKLPQLEKLAQTSKFYAVFVEILKKDPSTMDKLASKIGKNSIANLNNQSEGDYARFFVEYYCDSAFTIGLINGQAEITSVFNSLTVEDQKLLITNSLAVFQHADFETWAEGSRFSIQSPTPAPQENNPYSDYYKNLRNYLNN